MHLYWGYNRNNDKLPQINPAMLFGQKSERSALKCTPEFEHPMRRMGCFLPSSTVQIRILLIYEEGC